MLCASGACDRAREGGESGGPSPSSSLVPSPLAGLTSPVDLTGATAGAEPGPAEGGSPVATRADRPLPADALSTKEALGVVFAAEWRWPDMAGPPKAPEVNPDGLASARRLTALRWVVSATEAGRLRVTFDARAFPLPLGSELRSRADHYGHALVFPSGTEYRVVPPGGLRSVFGERRLDVAPLVAGEVRSRGAGPAWHGRAVRRTELFTRIGSMQLDTVEAPEAGQGAALLCRLLVELVAVDPAGGVCVRDELPVRAQFTWPGGGGVVFEAVDAPRKREVPIGEVLCPPAQASFAAAAMPQPAGIFLTRDEASALRLRAVEVGPPAPDAPAEGVFARNTTDGLRYLLLDGVPLAWVAPGAEQYIVGPPRGRYVAQWRSFLGDAVSLPRPTELPARLTLSEGAEAAPAAKPK